MVVQIIGITPLIEKFCIKKAGGKLSPADTEIKRGTIMVPTIIVNRNVTIFVKFLQARSGLDLLVIINDNMQYGQPHE